MQQRHLQLFVLVISLPLLLRRLLPCTAAVAAAECGSSIHQNPCSSGFFRKALIPGFAVMRGPRGGPRASSKAASRTPRSSSQGSPAARQQQQQPQKRQQQQRQKADAARHAAARSPSQVSLGEEEADTSRNTLKGLFSGLREQDVLSAFGGPQGSPNKPVLGVPIAEAVSKSSSSSSKLQQILKAGDYSRLRPSFLGSFLLPVQPNEQQQQQANGGCVPEYVASHCFPAGAEEEDDAAAAAAADTLRGTLRERLLQQLLQGLLQQQQLPEIAVAGRSNVGKSSLINAFFKLCSNNNNNNGSKLPHARSSRTPGRTQAVDFYLFSVAAASTQRQQHQQQQQQQQLLQRGALVLTDLPGYGYTEGISPERAWQISRTLEVYVQRKQQQQQQLQQVLLLIDGRRGMGAHDAALMRLLLQQQIPTAVAITKEDRLSAAQFVELVENLSAYKHLVLPPYLMQLRMKLLLEQQRRSISNNKGKSDDCNKTSSSTENEESDVGGDDVYSSCRSNWSSKSASRGSLFSSFRSPYASDTPIEQQVQQQERSKQQVPVFLVSARTGSGIKQLWQHVLRTAAKGPPRANLATAGAPAATATPAAEQAPPSLKRRAEMSRRMALLLAGPEHMPDDCF